MNNSALILYHNSSHFAVEQYFIPEIIHPNKHHSNSYQITHSKQNNHFKIVSSIFQILLSSSAVVIKQHLCSL